MAILTEPMTMFTDYLIAVECLYFFVVLQRLQRGDRQLSRAYWMWALAFSALASLVGGSMHGFAAVLTPEWKLAAWKVAQYTAGVVAFCFTMGSVKSTLAARLHPIVLWLAVAELLVYGVWMAFHDEFIFVIIDYGSAMLLVLAMQGYAWWRWPRGTERDFIIGVLVSFLAAGVQASGFSLHKNFNYNDLYHVIQMVGIYFFFRGAYRLTDRGVSET